MDPLFEASWDRIWPALGAAGRGHAVRDAVLQGYAEPHRRYHTLQHLAECLTLLAEVRDAADHPDEVEMALWFHDAVYALRASDNEARSAEWAAEALRSAGVSVPVFERVRALILATQHKALPQSRDAQVLVDVDLSILGAPPERFAEYEVQIRQEYAHVPGFLFRLKRRAILQSFLDRPALFSTPRLHQRLEARARANLAAAVAG
ncbi:MAG: N-methyl-D-aspartate receptor NMDAR2C subunit [Rubrivivax sp.]